MICKHGSFNACLLILKFQLNNSHLFTNDSHWLLWNYQTCLCDQIWMDLLSKVFCYQKSFTRRWSVIMPTTLVQYYTKCRKILDVQQLGPYQMLSCWTVTLINKFPFICSCLIPLFSFSLNNKLWIDYWMPLIVSLFQLHQQATL